MASSSSLSPSLCNRSPLPAMLYEEELLVPLKWDITYGGARFVDSFCWPLYGGRSCRMSPDEFAARTCSDHNLPNGFHHRMTMQMTEQLDSFRRLVNQLHNLALAQDNVPWLQRLCDVQEITISIRLNNLEYSDKVYWDTRNGDITAEIFARTTCADLGLPAEMEPAIAHKIRETLFRLMLQWIDEPSSLEAPAPTEDADIKGEARVQLISESGLVSELWRRAKPDDSSIVNKFPHPVIPRDVTTNASTWF